MIESSPQKSTFARKIKRVLISVFRILLVLLIMLAWFQRSLIYHPNQVAELSAKNSGLSQVVVDVSLTAHDNLKLNGWLAFADDKSLADGFDVKSQLAEGRPLVIIFPGNAGNRSNRGHLLKLLGSVGADAMIFDYRGYGENPGSPSEANFCRDAHTIWKYVTEELNVPPNRIVLYGESLGGGTAARLAGDLGSEGIEPAGLILQSTFNSLVDTGRYHFWYLPVNLILIDRFESERHIVQAKCPVLQLHGEQDEVVPLPLGQKLFEAAPPKSVGGIPKQQILFPNTTHNDVYLVNPKMAIDAIQAFLTNIRS